MKKILLSAVILASILSIGVHAQSIELVKISTYTTGTVAGTYDEYPSRGVKMGNKIILNDTYSVIQTDTVMDSNGKYIFTTNPKQNITLCVYDKDKNEYCDYQNINVLKIDKQANDINPTKVLLQYDGNKLPNVDISNILTGGVNTGSKYLSFDLFNGSGYYTQDINVIDLLGDKYLTTDKNVFLNDYNGIIKNGSDVFKINSSNTINNTNFNAIGVSSLISGELADFINGSTGVLINKRTSSTVDFVKYFTNLKDPTIIDSINLKLDNSDMMRNKPLYLNPTAINTTAKNDIDTYLGIDMIGYIGNPDAYISMMQKNNSIGVIETKNINHVDANGRKRMITKNITPDYNDITMTGSTGSKKYLYYYGSSKVSNRNLLLVSYIKTLGSSPEDDNYKNLLNKISIKSPIVFSLPKELGINFVNPEKYNYFIINQNDMYSAVDTSSTSTSIYLSKNSNTNAKQYIKGSEKDYKYVINGNNSPMYIKNTKFDKDRQFDIVLPTKNTDGTDAVIFISAYVTNGKQELINLNNLLNKSLSTNVKIKKTKSNAKAFKYTLSDYFKSIK